MRKQKPFVITMLSTCMILMGLTVQGYPQEGPNTAKEPHIEKMPEDLQKLPTRPPRYPGALAGLEVIVDLNVDTSSYTGPCPAVFKFNGRITVNRPGIVQYRFFRSDNTRYSLGILKFEKAGAQEITDTWVFDDPAQLPDFKGWEAVEVTYPMKARSNLIYFQGTCADYKGGPPSPESPKAQQPSTEPKELPWPQPDPALPPVKR